MKMRETSIESLQAPEFDLDANHLCLDFANTLNDRLEAEPRELLNSYHDLVAWNWQAHTLTGEEALRLLDAEPRDPAGAATVLREAIEVRETIFRIFSAVAKDRSPDGADLLLLNAALSGAMVHACVAPRGNAFAWTWVEGEDAPGRALWPVVRAAADLLTSPELHAVRMCAADDCAWLFLDTSKNHSRRWCNMRTCGNRAKVRRHYAQQKKPASAS
jgi:predicted RNA-binding Zn ribbon-like protein